MSVKRTPEFFFWLYMYLVWHRPPRTEACLGICYRCPRILYIWTTCTYFRPFCGTNRLYLVGCLLHIAHPCRCPGNTHGRLQNMMRTWLHLDKETSASLALCEGNLKPRADSPHKAIPLISCKGPVKRSFDVCLTLCCLPYSQAVKQTWNASRLLRLYDLVKMQY